MRNRKLTANILVIIFIMSTLLVGCSGSSKNLMEDISKNAIPTKSEFSLDEFAVKQTDFALRLFNTCRLSDENGKNTLVSPLSVLMALAMTANGADGDTLDEMEKTLGMTKDELNDLSYTYMEMLSLRNPKFGKLSLANSIWFTDDKRFTVNQSFLQTNKDYYEGDIYKAPFDKTTLDDINQWVKDKTDGMIPSILNDIPSEVVMYLVNALAFDAEWTEPYLEIQVKDGIFTTEDGKKETKSFLCGEENTYIEDENSVGFIKYYKGCKYGFAAILPNEGISVDDYLDSVDGMHIYQMLTNKKNSILSTAIPKFKTEYSSEMSDQLKNMGIKQAFDINKADFRNLGTSTAGNIFIKDVFHKTFISVDEKGTKAGAATVIALEDGALFLSEPREIYLDRPFIYMLIDCETNSPIFIGVMRDLEL